MRYADGGELAAGERARREDVWLQAARLFEQNMSVASATDTRESLIARGYADRWPDNRCARQIPIRIGILIVCIFRNAQKGLSYCPETPLTRQSACRYPDIPGNIRLIIQAGITGAGAGSAGRARAHLSYSV